MLSLYRYRIEDRDFIRYEHFSDVAYYITEVYHTMKYSKKEFQSFCDEAVSRLKDIGSGCSGDDIALYLHKYYGFIKDVEDVDTYVQVFNK